MKIKYYIFAAVILILEIIFTPLVPVEKSCEFENLDEITDETEYFTLPDGDFKLTINYSSTIDNRAEIFIPQMQLLELPSTSGADGSAVYEFTLKHDMDQGMIRFVNPQSDEFRINSIRIDASEYINRDALVPYYLIAILLAALVIFVGKQLGERPFGKEQIISFVILSLVFFITIAPWVISSEIYRGSDTRDHLQRIEGVMFGLEAGQFPVIIYPNLCNNFGELGILYPNTLLLFPALLRMGGLSMGVSYRIFMVAICLFQIVAAYFSSRLILKTGRLAVISTAVYCLTPYLLYNMYQKGTAAGKSMAAAFIPLLFAGIYSIVTEEKGKKKWYLLPIAFVGILQSHVVSTFFTACFLFVIAVTLFKELFMDRDNLVALLKAALATICINEGFLITFVYYYFSDWDRSRLEWRDFFDGLLDWGRLTGDGISYFPLAVIIVCAFVYLLKGIRFEDLKEKKLFLVFAIVEIVFFWLSTPFFPWRILCRIDAINTLTNLIQAPHRFILYCTMPASLWIAKALDFRNGKKLMRILTGIVVIALLLYGTVIQFQEYYKKAVLLNGTFGNIYTRVAMDYLPTGTTEEDFYSDTGRVSDESVINSIYYEKEDGVCTYLYSTESEGEYAEFPLLYYDGYKAYDQDGKEMEVYKGDGSHVRVYLETGENRSIVVGFKTKRIFTAVYIFSIVSAVIFAIMGIMRCYSLSVSNEGRSRCK